MESRAPAKPRLVFTMQTKEAYRQLQLDYGMVLMGKTFRSDLGMAPSGQASSADAPSSGEMAYVASVCDRADTNVLLGGGPEFSCEEQKNRSTAMNRRGCDTTNRNCATPCEATFSPAITDEWQRAFPNNGKLGESTQHHQNWPEPVDRMSKRREQSEQRGSCASERVNETPVHCQIPSGKVQSALFEYGTRRESDKAFTRCSVQVGANRNCCFLWKNPSGSKTHLPKALIDLPRKANTTTQTAMLSFSAPAQLGRANPATYNPESSPITLQPNVNINSAEHQLNRSSQDVHLGVDQDLPTYEEFSRTQLLTPSSDPPPGYHELFRTVLPESPNLVQSGGGPTVPRGLAARTFWKPSTARHQKRRCCFGCLNDRECWILALVNGAFILIFILAALYSK